MCYGHAITQPMYVSRLQKKKEKINDNVRVFRRKNETLIPCRRNPDKFIYQMTPVLNEWPNVKVLRSLNKNLISSRQNPDIKYTLIY